MEIADWQQNVAEGLGEGLYYFEGSFYELYKRGSKWHVNVLWGRDEQTVFVLTDDLAKQGIKLDQRHFDAIKLVETLDKTDGDEDDREEDDEAEKEIVPITAAEEIVQNLFTARTVSDEELAIGFIRNPKTNDVYKVIVQYIGNRSNE